MIRIYTDGSCIANPGPGGWAAIILEDGSERTLHGGDDSTTNNRMEMLAVVKGLEAIPESTEVTIYSDSQYVINTMTRNWKRRANLDIWDLLDAEVVKRPVKWQWVRGHAGDPFNEKADALANKEARMRTPGGSAPEATSSAASLTHIDESGKASMVDVGWKPETERVAVANGSIVMKPETLALIESNGFEKGDVLGVARIAGVMGAKSTSQLIPLCHPIPLDQVTVEFEMDHVGNAVVVTATARTTAKTGVEMEAMTAVSISALTIYDMCKSIDRGMRVECIRLVKKSGGKSGDYVLEDG